MPEGPWQHWLMVGPEREVRWVARPTRHRTRACEMRVQGQRPQRTTTGEAPMLSALVGRSANNLRNRVFFGAAALASGIVITR